MKLYLFGMKKVGIDIERIDRGFNNTKLAKKYFLKSNRSNYMTELNKKSILKQWCVNEAGIKSEYGKFAEGIKQWKYLEIEKMICHKKKKNKFKIYQNLFL